VTAAPPSAGIEERLSAAGLPALPRSAWLEIDLDAIAANARAIRSILAPGVGLAPVVKADAYGHGLTVVARTLVASGVDVLCVATFDEAVVLRDAGIEHPVLVLFQPPFSALEEAAARRIDVAASDAGRLDALLDAWDRIRRAWPGGSSGGPVPDLRLHLEVETGLERAGVAPERVPAALTAIGARAGVVVAGLWSHLASAPDRAVTADQVARFDRARDLVAAAGLRCPPRHIDASGALFAGTAPHLELVRPGLSIYGVLPTDLPVAPEVAGAAAALVPAMSLRARPLRLEDVPAGHGVGYGGRWVAPRPSRVATLPVGYGDGWGYGAAGAEALVRGRRVRQVGTVAMDAIMVDVTDVPGVGPADEFVLLGGQGDDRITAHELARHRTTIPYEILAGMSRRLPRVYDLGAGPIGLRTLSGEFLREATFR